MMSNGLYRKLISLSLVLAVAVVVWYFVSSTPIGSHSHNETGHSHFHVHDGVSSHDHDHFAMIGKTSHTHPHVHRHSHDAASGVKLQEGLSEFGHIHDGDEIQTYWFEASVDAKSIAVQFWVARDGKLERAICEEERLAGFLAAGGRIDKDILLTREFGVYVGQIPDQTIMLPNSILGVGSVTIDGNEFQNLRAPIAR